MFAYVVGGVVCYAVRFRSRLRARVFPGMRSVINVLMLDFFALRCSCRFRLVRVGVADFDIHPNGGVSRLPTVPATSSCSSSACGGSRSPPPRDTVNSTNLIAHMDLFLFPIVSLDRPAALSLLLACPRVVCFEPLLLRSSRCHAATDSKQRIGERRQPQSPRGACSAQA